MINQIIIMIDNKPPVDEEPTNEAFDLVGWSLEHLSYDFVLKHRMSEMKVILQDHLPRMAPTSVESGGLRNPVPPLCTPTLEYEFQSVESL